jgi:DNA-binding NtrC family response regulator
MARILVVDDEIGIRELLSEILYDEGHTVQLAENAAQAREARLRGRPDLVLLDMPVVMMSGHATVDTAVEATRIGAVDFLEKPITMQRLLKTVASGLERTVAPKALAAAARPVIQGGDRRPETASMAPGMAPAMAVPEVEQDESQLGSISLDLPLREARDEFERIYFEYHLRRENHSMTRVSERTGLERTHLYRKLKQLGIDSSRKRNQS